MGVVQDKGLPLRQQVSEITLLLKKLTNRGWYHQFIGSSAGNRQACATYPCQLLSSLRLLPQPQSLGRGVQDTLG